MTIIFYPAQDNESEPSASPIRQAVRESVISIHHAAKAADAERRQIAAARTRVTTFRIPVDLLKRLDEIAEDAATNRGHLLRQIIAEYVCYVDEHQVRYKGSLLTAQALLRKAKSWSDQPSNTEILL
ncbi:MAG: ribbon-helix-helix protein, CopG family [Burkholderiales bacterium]|nr:ribbon-helix-helix protein, CopG family [Burkholderiales bacterium]